MPCNNQIDYVIGMRDADRQQVMAANKKAVQDLGRRMGYKVNVIRYDDPFLPLIIACLELVY